MKNTKSMPALTFDVKKDGWNKSSGFTKRSVPAPVLDEKKNIEDAISVIVKVKYAGVCGSDRGIWHRNGSKDLLHDSLAKEGKTMRILGHEFVGQIIKTGSLVKSMYCDFRNPAKIEVGSLVSGDSHITCGKCYQCRIGENNVCINELILGISVDGVFANYIKIPAKNLWAVDGNKVKEEIASIYDPFGNAVHATSKIDVRGQQVAVFGVGPIGLFSVLLLKNFGAAKIIAADINPENLKMAQELGADETILIEEKEKNKENGYSPRAFGRIMEFTKGKGVDVAMEMAGPQSSLNNAIESTRRGGQIILFGIKDGDFIIPKFSRLITKGLTLHGVIGRRIFGTWQVAQRVLSNRSNGIQEKIWEIILKKGKGTIIDFSDYEKDSFQKSMDKHPKIIFKM